MIQTGVVAEADARCSEGKFQDTEEFSNATDART